MQLPGFENAYFLQSLGWAIANSFWQVGILWLLYQVITSFYKDLSSMIKHHLSIALSSISFVWFVVTLIRNFQAISIFKNLQGTVIDNWILKFKYINVILPYLSFGYLAVLCLYSVQFFQNLLANRNLQKAGLTKASIDFRLFTTHTAIHLGIKRKVQVWISSLVDVPSVTGFIKPIILLPAALVNQLSVRQVEAILIHELAHIKRNDYIINLGLSFIELVLFFNPFVFLLGRIARRERENCCDDWVITYRYNQYDYAQTLLFLEEQRQLQPAFALAATNCKKNLLNRIKRLFHSVPQTNFSTRHQIKLISLCIVLLVAIVITPGYLKTPLLQANNQRTDKTVVKIDRNINMTLEKRSSQTYVSNPVATSVTAVSNLQKSRKANRIKKQPKKEIESPYVNAFINEELLTSHRTDEGKAIPAAKNEGNDVSYFVKIEEQQSGKKQTNIYLFELKSENNKPSIKPLIILNKLKVSVDTTSPAVITDSIVKPVRKRVTS